MSTIFSKLTTPILATCILFIVILYILQMCETKQVRQELSQSKEDAAKRIGAIQEEYQNLYDKVKEIDEKYKEKVAKENQTYENERKVVDEKAKVCMAAYMADDEAIVKALEIYGISVLDAK